MKNIILFILATLLSLTVSFGQGKLKKAEESLNDKERTRSNHRNSGTRGSSDGNFFADTFGYVIVEAFLYASYYSLVESPYEYNSNSHYASITKYPYFNSNKGNYNFDWDETTTKSRLTLSNRYVFEGNRINGNHLNLDIRFLKRIAIEVDYLQLWEQNKNFGDNNLAIYTALAKYHRVRTEKFDAWWGLGGAYIDGEVNEFGFTYSLGAELFFAKPMSLESNFNQTLINQETVNKFNALLNYHKKQYKFTGGYEHLKIGSQDFSTIALGVGLSF